MTLDELLAEQPTFRNSEMPNKIARPFYSEDTLEKNHEFIYKGTTFDGKDYWVVMRRNKEFASLGFPGRKPDVPGGKFGMDIIAVADFKNVNLSGLKTIPVGKNVLQIATVEVGPKFQRNGWGLCLYTALADAGYVVISDNTQYIGGKQLWKKIAENTLHGQYKVYVLDHGVPRLDANGKPLEYNSSNIDDADLWSENSSKKYTLFVLKKTG